MDFLFTINNNYVEPIKTLIFSIAINNGNYNDYHFIYNNLSKENRNNIEKYVIDNNLGNVHFHYFTKDLQNIAIQGNWSIEILYRLYAPVILKDIDKVLYLDGDTIVNSDLSDLYNINLGSYALAAVPNDSQVENITRLNLTQNAKYYNSGVLLLNLKKMKHILKDIDISEFLLCSNTELIFPDQDMINILFQNQIIEVDKTYNYMINLTERKSGYSKIKNPKIIHYVLEKPWKEYSEYLTDYYYLKYLYKRGLRTTSVKLFWNHRVFRLKNKIKRLLAKSYRVSNR